MSESLILRITAAQTPHDVTGTRWQWFNSGTVGRCGDYQYLKPCVCCSYKQLFLCWLDVMWDTHHSPSTEGLDCRMLICAQITAGQSLGTCAKRWNVIFELCLTAHSPNQHNGVLYSLSTGIQTRGFVYDTRAWGHVAHVQSAVISHGAINFGLNENTQMFKHLDKW